MRLKQTAITLCAAALLGFSASASAQDTATTQAAPQAAQAAPSNQAAPPPAEQAASPPADQATPPPSDHPAAAESDTTSATVGPPPDHKAMVVFFRPSEFVGGALTFTAREGETILGHVGSGRYFAVPVDPGVHEFNIRGGETVRVETEEGETLYLRLHVSMGLLSGHGALAPSTKAEFDAHPLRVWN
jgi:hypothetical protein